TDRHVSAHGWRVGRWQRRGRRNPHQERSFEPARAPEGQNRHQRLRGGLEETSEGVAALTDCVIDTVALVRHLEDDLPRGAGKVFRDAEAGRIRLLLPEIALAEFVYIAPRGRLRTPNPRAIVAEVPDCVRESG